MPSPAPSWYEIASSAELRQGSLLRAFPLVKPPKDVHFDSNGQPKPVGGKVRISDVVVVSQSCDLAQNKSGMVFVAPLIELESPELVLVAPVVDLAQADKLAGPVVSNDQERLDRYREQIRRGYQPPLHMLAACNLEGFAGEIQVVDFRQAMTVNFEHLKKHSSTSEIHLRLCSPFREQLSQAFARFFMRVALELDAEIAKFADLP